MRSWPRFMPQGCPIRGARWPAVPPPRSLARGRLAHGLVTRVLPGIQAEAEPADHDVAGAAPDRPAEHLAALVVQDPLPGPGGLHFRDQHDETVIAVFRLDLPQVLDDRHGQGPAP